MKILTVKTDDTTETYELSGEAVLTILPYGQLWCEDGKVVIAYATGKYVSAVLRPTKEV